MKFRTEYQPTKSPLRLDPERPIVAIGSCFAENIAARMRRCLWDAQNPAGTLFNPYSIAKALRICLIDDDEEARGKFAASLFEDKGIWHSWLFDSKMSAGCSPEECMARFLEMRECFVKTMENTQALVFTLGTAWVYFLNATDDVVANCHKQPQSLFTRERMSIEEIERVLDLVLRELRMKYPALEIILTVSPVRHVKDGLHGNLLSKSLLLLAAEGVCGRHPFCHYFPAYEILTDDLRDYRFYASDLVHPSDEAVEYIWEKFRQTYLDPKAEELLQQGERLNTAFLHRPIVADTPQEEKRREKVNADLAAFLSLHPFMLLPAHKPIHLIKTVKTSAMDFRATPIVDITPDVAEALREVKAMRKGEKPVKSMNDFLND